MAVKGEKETAILVVVDGARLWMAKDLDDDICLTIVALASEDPANWEEAKSAWSRYRTRLISESIDAFPFEETDREHALTSLRAAPIWFAIDFPHHRVFIHGMTMEVGRDAVLAAEVDDSSEKPSPLSIHLPPWWEMHEDASADHVFQPRSSPVIRPYVDREVLYGDAFLEDIANRILSVVASLEWRESNADKDESARHPFTVQVHRDWLMTTRTDLGGRMPRQLLHGARNWLGLLTDSQSIRIMNGEPIVALPVDWSGFETAPIGSQEMILYFDLCREVIQAGWFWCATEAEVGPNEVGAASLAPLIEFLRSVKDNWLSSPFEGGAPPASLIEYDRRRVPCGTGTAIEGIEDEPVSGHVIDCDCPICEMMAEGMFGIGFTSLDGHQLDSDDEFAFSMAETQEEWEKQLQEYADFSYAMNQKSTDHDADDELEDVYASAWSGIQTDEQLPGDKSGFLKKAFMVAEIISCLKEVDAPSHEIQGLNECFANYRRSEGDQRLLAASQFKENLQTLADRYPSLVSKSADLQSRVDESARSAVCDDTDPDAPF